MSITPISRGDMEPEKEQCSRCRFWHEMSEDDGVIHGYCKRHPPVYLHPTRSELDECETAAETILYTWEQPRVVEYDWCGEFQPASKSTSAA